MIRFFTTNELAIFHCTAILHEYIKPEKLSLEDTLSVNTGWPWAGSTSWKVFCKLFCVYLSNHYLTLTTLP